jgi:hypothetical protein
MEWVTWLLTFSFWPVFVQEGHNSATPHDTWQKNSLSKVQIYSTQIWSCNVTSFYYLASFKYVHWSSITKT